MTQPEHLDRLLALLSLNEKHPRVYNLTLGKYDIITTCDAVALFDKRPNMDVLFVYFRDKHGLELNVCFQRCFLACEPVTQPKTVEEWALEQQKKTANHFLQTAGHPIDKRG